MFLNLGYQFNGFEIILTLAVMILLGYIFGKLAERVRLPEVTGYIVAGIVINLVVGKLLSMEDDLNSLIHSLEVVTMIALGFISFTLGTKLFFPKIKDRLKLVIIVLLIQTVLVVGLTVLLFYLVFPTKLWLALLIAGISATTASAPVIEITRKFETSGPLTNTLMPLIGLDNILGTIVFLLTVVGAMFVKDSTLISFDNFIKPFIGLGFSILLGLFASLLFIFMERKVLSKYLGDEKYESYLLSTVAVVLITIVGAQVLGAKLGFQISPFIAPLVLGIVFTNSLTKEEYQYETNVVNKFTPPLITAFFVIAGAELDITRIFEFGGYALLYVTAHTLGKYIGAYFGTRLVKGSEDSVKKYLPTSTLTQGGFEIFFALGLASLPFIMSDPSAVADMLLVKSIVLTAVLIIELFAPLLLTKSLHKAGEVNLELLNSEKIEEVE